MANLTRRRINRVKISVRGDKTYVALQSRSRRGTPATFIEAEVLPNEKAGDVVQRLISSALSENAVG